LTQKFLKISKQVAHTSGGKREVIMPFTFGECQACVKPVTMEDAIVDGYLKDSETGKVKHKICYEDKPPKARKEEPNDPR
jgi:hypothetical protein